MQTDRRDWLRELTSIPTAAGREDGVVKWIKSWVQQRPRLTIDFDPAGNITISRLVETSERPVYFTAHLDHPAFVVIEPTDSTIVLAEFRGGVAEPYFPNAAVRHHGAQGQSQRGVVSLVDSAAAPDNIDIIEGSRPVHVVFDQPVSCAKGDILTWDLPAAYVENGQLRAPACDDLAAVAAALAAYDRLLAAEEEDAAPPDVRLLFTRAEEVGFIGAIAACRHGTVPADARLVCLENSKSSADAPIGAGPIVRVGDRTSTFDPNLTYRIGKIAESLVKADDTFKFQRKLMVGGTCEASAFQAFGFTATCICLPLGNYHNMNEQTGAIDSETISIADFDQLVKLLVATAQGLSASEPEPGLAPRLDELFDKRCSVLDRDA